MTDTFEEKLRTEINQRLNKYIDFTYEQYVQYVNNEDFINSYHSEIEKISEHYQSYCENEFEAICISIFILELSYLNRNESWHITLNNKTKPLLNNGASELLKAVEAFGLNAYNIEEITIKTKHPDNYIKEKETNPNKTSKDNSGPYLNISGRIAINRIMNGVSNKETIQVLQNIQKEDKPEKKEPINFFKESAKALYPYLNKYFDHLPSENERYYLGAHLLDAVDIKPNYRNIAKLEQEENAYKRAMINNFKKAVL